MRFPFCKIYPSDQTANYKRLAAAVASIKRKPRAVYIHGSEKTWLVAPTAGLRAEERLSLLFKKVTLLHEKVNFHLSVTYNLFSIWVCDHFVYTENITRKLVIFVGQLH